MKIYTIGFTTKKAGEFFEPLKVTEARFLLDIRVHNNSQLAGFTKKGNIEYFTEQLTHLEYRELPLLAPAEELFKEYRRGMEWSEYEARYLTLLDERKASIEIDREMFGAGVVLLCSEPTPENCHRRLAAEYLKTNSLPGAEIVHI
ncbi:MAG: DUF488 domain-containing protein [SAR202 cluster bacterium]|jgi:uncharacterized protein (DUF488 family)|nr:DUF488 domain-containing protein [SAR202 cluster bacterium]MDP6514029.1 DUF488 domain-containing protein [SAR202 cluster bacterium]